MIRYALSAFCGFAVLLSSLPAFAQVNRERPDALQDLSIEEQLGSYIPLDARFARSNGDSVQLGDLLEEGKPVIFNPLYYECPMLCGLVLDGVLNVVDELKWKPGKDFIVISLSIDPDEDAAVAARAKSKHLGEMDSTVRDGWHFLTGNESQIRKAVSSAGFEYKKIQETGEYAHSAAIILLSPKGKITRYLYGIEYDEFNVRSALYESAEGKIGNTVTKLVMYCYQYDPDSGSYAPVAINIMKLGGLATLIILGIFLGLLWLRETKRKTNL